MSGHSKWANIKHKKGKTDAQKAKAFTKVTREIIVATKAGGGDPDSNFRLRLAIQKAKEVNMPNDNIMRAIKKGLGSTDGENYEEIIYEGYGPGGIAFLVETLSDNRNRTASEMRYVFSRNGGNLGETGCVSWMFEKKGVIEISKAETDLAEEEILSLLLEAGAEDMRQEEDYYEIISGPGDFETVRNYIEGKLPISRAELTYLPKNTTEVSGEEAKMVLKLVEALEEHDDVQNVYTNFEMSDEELNNYHSSANKEVE